MYASFCSGACMALVVQCYDISVPGTISRVSSLIGHKADVSALAANARHLFSAGLDGHILVWDILSNKCIYRLFHSSDGITSLALHHHHHYLFSVGGNTLTRWNLQGLLPEQIDPISSPNHSPPLLSLSSVETIHPTRPTSAEPGSISMSPDRMLQKACRGRPYAVVVGSGCVFVGSWSMAACEGIQILCEHTLNPLGMGLVHAGPIISMTYLRNMLYSTAKDGSLVVWKHE
mmetsp:Transcript_31366/g.50643  ORF Transcript_31366/g.50643 Transcript_31366/m.50643 type:complete len:232 (-) Transcript_31366:698-1393(-)